MLPTLEKECSEFLALSNGEPLTKNLIKNNDGFRRVKIRKKKWTSEFVDSFNMAFLDYNNLMQRSIFASKISPSCEDTYEPFYIFPINGFKYIYAPNVRDTYNNYKELYEKLLSCVQHEGVSVFKDVLKYHFVNKDLAKGISDNSEIIIYDIPYYYAIRKSLIDDYKQFFYDNDTSFIFSDS